ncbi:hypothetical protein [Pseudomonas baetica]|uniref:hypothetical protein n=1 Tax=Pseudomonas baetica TaxID=674054 RepID=UPI0024061083|nr:hypothetical protein [Pseudomonas baetica]MDF9778984.1 hypothetical protein [Pseudomonas baetica]
MSTPSSLSILAALRDPQRDVREAEHTKITKQLERQIRKLNLQSKADSLTMAEKIAIKAKVKPLADQLHKHKLNFFSFIDSANGSAPAPL